MSYESKMEKIRTMEKELAALKKEVETEQKIEFTIDNYRNKKIVVHCKTRNDSDVFLAYLTGKGIGWYDESAISGAKNWCVYDVNTCYSFNNSAIGSLAYGSQKFYNREGYQIIDFDINMLK